MLRKALSIVLLCLMIACVVDAVLVLWFHGFRFELFGRVFRSSTIEFPVLSFLGLLVANILVQGKIKEAALLCGSLVVACVIGEGVLHVAEHPWSQPVVRSWRVPDDLLGYRSLPNFEGIAEAGEHIKINSQGFRDDEHTLEKPEGALRVLGLGDSFMFGWGLPLEQSFLKQLQRQLEQETGTQVETINAGVTSYGLAQYYIYLKNIGVTYHPDVVVLAYFVNDLPDSLEIQERLPPATFEEKPLFKGRALHYSRLYNFLTAAASAIRSRNRAIRVDYLRDMEVRRAFWAKQKYLFLSDANGPERVKILKEYLRRIKHLAAGAGSKLVMVFIPDLSLLRHPEFHSINGVLSRLTHEEHIPFYDMTPVFEGGEDLTTYYLYPRDLHTNVEGNKQIAQALTTLICRDIRRPTISCQNKVAPREQPR